MASTPPEDFWWAIFFIIGGSLALTAGFIVVGDTGTRIGAIICEMVVLAICFPIVKGRVNVKQKTYQDGTAHSS